MKKLSQSNLLMLEDKPIAQTQFLNSKAGKIVVNESIKNLTQPQVSPNVAGELLMIQESFKNINKQEGYQDDVSFTKTVPLKIVQLHRNESPQQNPSLDQSSADYNESKSQYHDKAFKSSRKRSIPFLSN